MEEWKFGSTYSQSQREDGKTEIWILIRRNNGKKIIIG
jgi:hypothetical protein